jgi:hypothetical protein
MQTTEGQTDGSVRPSVVVDAARLAVPPAVRQSPRITGPPGPATVPLLVP